VIYTSPTAGEKLEAGGLAILYVSLGPRVSTLKVPNVCGLAENKAAERIVASGFAIGNITYKSSPEKAGTVLSQSPSYDQRAKKGSSVSIEVSAGQEFNYKSVPSLYGLTLTQAKERLAEYGLVAGNIYAAESNEPKGTVISQSPAADTPISPSLVGVDMYVSS
jgi:serine/threonine-protein kinase